MTFFFFFFFFFFLPFSLVPSFLFPATAWPLRFMNINGLATITCSSRTIILIRSFDFELSSTDPKTRHRSTSASAASQADVVPRIAIFESRIPEPDNQFQSAITNNPQSGI